jgi:hypothetical protein
MRKESDYISSAYPLATITLTSMTSSTSLRRGAISILQWTYPTDLITNFNISLYYSSTLEQVMATGVTSPYTFQVPATLDYGSYYYLRIVPWKMDESLVGKSSFYEDTGYISVSANGGGGDTSSSGGGGTGAGVGITVAFLAGVFVFAVYKRHRERQAQADFEKMGVATEAGRNPPPPPSRDDQYITEGIPLCYYETVCVVTLSRLHFNLSFTHIICCVSIAQFQCAISSTRCVNPCGITCWSCCWFGTTSSSINENDSLH